MDFEWDTKIFSTQGRQVWHGKLRAKLIRDQLIELNSIPYRVVQTKISGEKQTVLVASWHDDAKKQVEIRKVL